ncbi:hypothetical protein BKA67DRAFT_530649 [Truncatella angustata]|uniref:Uncharacterized protein n=1 Tax=Truncatella angustata TaxID=152316 RepID=A0A9P8UZ41_9PEZI|nr:uncharacterized protein BKA67DRAFT_530649 [Truncatella angustata]KAH6660554.1 hypothetical protein BKA67DRAFT_530649 [Truncatella angustata]
MRFTSFIVTGVLALAASAQTTTDSTTTTEASTTVASTGTSTASSVQATDSAQAAVLACLGKCEAGDVDCQAQCINVPSPDESAVNKTNECSNACVQGNGTQAETEAYAACLQDCVNKYYFPSSVGTTTGTGATGSGSSGSVSTTSVATTITSGGSTFATTVASTITHGSSSGSATGTAAPSSSSGSAGDVVFRPGSSVVGLLGAFAAVLAL